MWLCRDLGVRGLGWRLANFLWDSSRECWRGNGVEASLGIKETPYAYPSAPDPRQPPCSSRWKWRERFRAGCVQTKRSSRLSDVVSFLLPDCRSPVLHSTPKLLTQTSFRGGRKPFYPTVLTFQDGLCLMF